MISPLVPFPGTSSIQKRDTQFIYLAPGKHRAIMSCRQGSCSYSTDEKPETQDAESFPHSYSGTRKEELGFLVITVTRLSQEKEIFNIRSLKRKPLPLGMCFHCGQIPFVTKPNLSGSLYQAEKKIYYWYLKLYLVYQYIRHGIFLITISREKMIREGTLSKKSSRGVTKRGYKTQLHTGVACLTQAASCQLLPTLSFI